MATAKTINLDFKSRYELLVKELNLPNFIADQIEFAVLQELENQIAGSQKVHPLSGIGLNDEGILWCEFGESDELIENYNDLFLKMFKEKYLASQKGMPRTDTEDDIPF